MLLSVLISFADIISMKRERVEVENIDSKKSRFFRENVSVFLDYLTDLGGLALSLYGRRSDFQLPCIVENPNASGFGLVSTRIEDNPMSLG